MAHKFDDGKTFVITISVVILIGSFVVGSQVVPQSLAQNSSQMGQDVERNETGNQTANQSAGLGDPAKMTVPSQQ
jgi:2-keto-4-pentenoate hydratase